jgi:hypothetical protein
MSLPVAFSKAMTLVLTTVVVLCSMLVGVAQATPAWRIDAVANTTVAPQDSLEYFGQITNIGDTSMDGSQITVTATLPTGILAQTAALFDPNTFINYPCFDASDGVSPVAGKSSLICTTTAAIPFAASGGLPFMKLNLTADVQAGAAGPLTAAFHVSGGGAGSAATVAPVVVTNDPPSFGVAAFDGSFAADASGAPLTQAGGHPYAAPVSIDFNTLTNPDPTAGALWPVEAAKDVLVDLPPGLVGNATVADSCTVSELANGSGIQMLPACPATSQVGTTLVRFRGNANQQVVTGPLPVFSLVTPPDVPAEFGFNVFGTIVVLKAALRSSGDYGLTVIAGDISEGLGIAGSSVTFWGVPSASAHDSERACPGNPAPSGGGPSCTSSAAEKAFLRLPTSCTDPGVGLPVTAHVDSWFNPGVFRDSTWISHEAPGYPYPRDQWGPEVGITGCAAVPFTPTIAATPTTNAADSPSGLNVDLKIPQSCWDAGEQESICQSDLKEAEVTLPPGMSVNPASATGLGACSPAQAGLSTPLGAKPIHFDQAPVSCPDSSKIGSVEIQTPLLKDPLKGAVYLAKQGDNPFNSLLAMYLVAEGSGVVVKQAGKIRIEPDGQLTTVFDEAPQTPFSDLRLELFGGPRAALKTPAACGTYATQAKLTPWSGNPAANVSDSFQITNCANAGFNPKLSAGSQNPLAGSFSPFGLRLTREDGNQELGALSISLPEGLLGSLKGIPYCPDATLAAISGNEGTGQAQINSPSCPAASQLGTVTVGAGAGPTPFYTNQGRAYLAGPYRGAPLSLAVVTPAVAGPFDLGTVVVRNALRINPETTQLTAVSDPLPTQLHGIPLDLRDIRVAVNRPGFTLNPTSCDPMSITSAIASAQGATANPSSRFQVGNCDRLAFKPKLTLALAGKTKRSGHPALRATLTMPSGGANIASASVALPHSEFLAQSHIRTVCTRVQFAAGAGNGAQCPAGSVYGKARAISPLLDGALEGPVYLRSSSNPLPDLVAALHGQIDVDLVGRIDSKNGGIRSTFDLVPDAPVSKFVLTMQGGKKGLLENSRNLCRSTNRAAVSFNAQNGKLDDFSPVVKADCGKRHKAPSHRSKKR